MSLAIFGTVNPKTASFVRFDWDTDPSLVKPRQAWYRSEVVLGSFGAFARLRRRWNVYALWDHSCSQRCCHVRGDGGRLYLHCFSRSDTEKAGRSCINFINAWVVEWSLTRFPTSQGGRSMWQGQANLSFSQSCQPGIFDINLLQVIEVILVLVELNRGLASWGWKCLWETSAGASSVLETGSFAAWAVATSRS